MQQRLLEHAAAMSAAAASGIGPDILIIVNCSQVQADFWQRRLTGPDDIHGAGTVIPEKTLVLSISEDNWHGRAGNALGNLNALVQAARKAVALGLLTVPAMADAVELADSLLSHCQDHHYCLSMLHTAGHAKRVAPLPSVEVNSKSNIRLPRIIRADEQIQPMTILEAVLIQANFYAASRQDRLCVFWGDQIIINAKDITCDARHHVEIFGQPVPIDDSIRSYGVLIATANDEYKVREKLTAAQVRGLLPTGCDLVYKSIGSFSLSLPFLQALLHLDHHARCLRECQGKLDSDLHWWQPLTSECQEYLDLMSKKNMPLVQAQAQWERIQKLWHDFSRTLSGDRCIRLCIGAKNVGAAALWWDYGQHRHYLRNLRIITATTLEGEVAKAFFGISPGQRQDDDSTTGKAEINNSVVLHSKIGQGRLKNCVVVDSVLDEVEARDAVIIGSRVLHLKAMDALCYNVVASEAVLKGGEVLANIFHPQHGRIEMRTDIGQTDDDWDRVLYANPYTFEQLFILMEAAKISAAAASREQAIRILEKSR